MNLQPINNLLATIGRVFIRRKSDPFVIFEDSVANIKVSNGVFGTATTHQWGIGYDVSEYNEAIILFVNRVNTAGGSIVSMVAQVQMWEPIASVWVNFGPQITVTSAGFTTAATNIGLASSSLPAPIGSIIRVGVTCSNTSTSDGFIDITLMLKG